MISIKADVEVTSLTKLADLSFLTGSERLELTSLRRYFSVFGWYYKDSRIFRLRRSKFSRMQDNNALVQWKFSFSAMEILIQCSANSNVTSVKLAKPFQQS